MLVEGIMFEEKGLAILKSLGFKKFSRPSQPAKGLRYDFDAEKDGVKYSIEIKEVEQSFNFAVPTSQLSEMAQELFTNKRKPLILFIDKSQIPIQYYLFEMKRASIGPIPVDLDEEGKVVTS